MLSTGAEMSLKAAREVLGVSSLSTPAEIQRAYRQACKRAHPDRGGDEGAFLQVTEAFRRLTEPLAPPAPRKAQRPAAQRPAAPPVDERLTITPALAANGGRVEHRLPDGRTLKISVPAGLRTGDTVRAGGQKLEVYVRAESGALLRGHDLWMTAHVTAGVLKRGGRVALDTPVGRKVFWINAKAAERGLVRLEGQGLPERARHPRGHLYIRLAQTTANDSLATALLRRFAAVWAA